VRQREVPKALYVLTGLALLAWALAFMLGH
jgi:hypothetical protein